jgi:hypothetical protein
VILLSGLIKHIYANRQVYVLNGLDTVHKHNMVKLCAIHYKMLCITDQRPLPPTPTGSTDIPKNSQYRNLNKFAITYQYL